MTKLFAVIITACSIAALSAKAAPITISGAGLAGLDYSGDPGDAQYVAGTPDVAQLFTADLSTNGDSPAVFANLGGAITLSAFAGSYSVLAHGSTVDPYWILYLTDDPTFSDPIISTFGSAPGPVSGSSLFHVGDLVNGSIDLSTLETTIDPLSGLAYGSETIAYVGLEIGDGGSGEGTANIESINISSSVPDSASTASLLGLGFLGLAAFSYRQSRRRVVL